MKKLMMVTLALVVLGPGVGVTQATLIGDTVDFDIVPTSFWSANPTSAVVGAGPETQLELNTTPFFSVDVGASSFTLARLGVGGLGLGANELFTISDMDWGATPGVVIGANLVDVLGGISGLTQADVSFTSDSVSVFLDGGASFPAGSSFTVALDVSHIPEPVTATLGLMGLATLGLATRRRAA